MAYLKEEDIGDPFEPFSAFREELGFVPALFRAQTLLPQVIAAEAALIACVVSTQHALSRLQKECIRLIVAAERRNAYCVSAQYQTLQLLGVPEFQLDAIMADHRDAGLSPETARLLSFVLALCANGFAEWTHSGLDQKSTLDAIVTTALERFLCALSIGLG